MPLVSILVRLILYVPFILLTTQTISFIFVFSLFSFRGFEELILLRFLGAKYFVQTDQLNRRFTTWLEIVEK
jgi:ABC-type multidrug transport system permease subunit